MRRTLIGGLSERRICLLLVIINPLLSRHSLTFSEVMVKAHNLIFFKYEVGNLSPIYLARVFTVFRSLLSLI